MRMIISQDMKYRLLLQYGNMPYNILHNNGLLMVYCNTTTCYYSSCYMHITHHYYRLTTKYIIFKGCRPAADPGKNV